MHFKPEWPGLLRDFFIQAGITLSEPASQPRAAMRSERLEAVRMGNVFPECLRLILMSTHMHVFPALFSFFLGSLIFAALLHGSCGCRGYCSSLFSCLLLVTCFFCIHCNFEWWESLGSTRRFLLSACASSSDLSRHSWFFSLALDVNERVSVFKRQSRVGTSVVAITPPPLPPKKKTKQNNNNNNNNNNNIINNK